MLVKTLLSKRYATLRFGGNNDCVEGLEWLVRDLEYKHVPVS